MTASAEPAPPILLTDADDGRPLDLRVGDRLMLRLHENAGAGYRWQFDGLDESIVSVQELGYERPPQAVGGAGDMQWLLRARSAGRTVLKLKLWRHWEGEGSVLQRFTVQLNVRSR